jgi:glycosyltransferase involved in cell wall biosynthesis
MRIGLVAPPFERIPPPGYAGTERVIAALADELTARGHEVGLFASGDSTSPGRLIATVPRARWPSSGAAAQEGLDATLATLRDHVGEFDVIHSHLETSGFELARRSPVPIVTTLHGRLDVDPVSDMIEGYRDVPLVAISASQRRWHPHARWLATVHHGLPLGAMPFRPTPGEWLVVVGRAGPEKGLLEAIELARLSGLRLRIAAKVREPDEQAYFARHVQPALGDGGVEFLGEVGSEVRDALLGGGLATLMLGAWPEPFGLVAIESLATGSPVIGRRAGALPELIEHGVDGFLVDDLQEASFALRSVGHLDRALIRQRALARFSAERMAADYERLYSELVTAARNEREGAPPP